MANKVIICGIDTSTLPKCTNEELNNLMKKIKSGDNTAREQFVIYNMRLVLSIVQIVMWQLVSINELFSNIFVPM